MNTHGNTALESNTYTEHDMMNGGVTINLLKLAVEHGHVATPEEVASIAAHDAMPRNTWYTLADVAAKQAKPEPVWMNDEYADLYGPVEPSPRPKRMSAYDRKHTTRS